MGEIHMKSNQLERAFDYYEKTNQLHQKLYKKYSQETTQKLHNVSQSFFEKMNLLDRSDKSIFEEKDQLLCKYVQLQERLLTHYPKEYEKQTIIPHPISSISLSSVHTIDNKVTLISTGIQPDYVNSLERVMRLSNASEKDFLVRIYSHLLDQFNTILYASFDYPSEDLYIYHEHTQMNTSNLSSYPIHSDAMSKVLLCMIKTLSNFKTKSETAIFLAIVNHFFSHACNLISYEKITPTKHGMKITVEMINQGNQQFFELLKQSPKEFDKLIRSKIQFHRTSPFIINKYSLGKSCKIRRYAFYAFISLNHLQLEWRINHVATWLQKPEILLHKNTVVKMYCLTPRNTLETVVYPIEVHYDSSGWLQKISTPIGYERKECLERIQSVIPSSSWCTYATAKNVVPSKNLPIVSNYLQKITSDEKMSMSSFLPLLVTESMSNSSLTQKEQIGNHTNNTGVTLNKMLEAVQYCTRKGNVRPTPQSSWLTKSSGFSRKRNLEGSFTATGSGKRQKTTER